MELLHWNETYTEDCKTVTLGLSWRANAYKEGKIKLLCPRPDNPEEELWVDPGRKQSKTQHSTFLGYNHLTHCLFIVPHRKRETYMCIYSHISESIHPLNNSSKLTYQLQSRFFFSYFVKQVMLLKLSLTSPTEPELEHTEWSAWIHVTFLWDEKLVVKREHM